MHNYPILDDRLNTIANYVRENKNVADIGTDHAYLITYLAAIGKINHGFACDINPLPLKTAQDTINKYNVSDKIECVLTDGLKGLASDKIDDIIIAGMGGDTILEIISAVDWIDKNKRLILQPMTKFERLREGLCKLGYKIIEETPVKSGKFIYTLIICEYAKNPIICTLLYKYLGEMPNSTNFNRFIYFKRIRNNIINRLEGLKNTQGHIDDIQAYNQIINKIDELMEGIK